MIYFRLKYLFFLVVALLISACNNPKKATIEENIAHNDSILSANKQDTVIVDCHYTFEQATSYSNAPKETIDNLQLITVHYYSFDEKLHQGQIVCHKSIAEDLLDIFEFICEIRFPVAKVIPAVHYNDDDKLSMNDNNTYCFSYRNIAYSKHVQGLAIDINPMQNPLQWKEGYTHRKDVPENASYQPERAGTFYPKHPVVKKFEEKGFLWGHYFKRNQDNHHFEKRR